MILNLGRPGRKHEDDEDAFFFYGVVLTFAHSLNFNADLNQISTRSLCCVVRFFYSASFIEIRAWNLTPSPQKLFFRCSFEVRGGKSSGKFSPPSPPPPPLIYMLPLGQHGSLTPTFWSRLSMLLPSGTESFNPLGSQFIGGAQTLHDIRLWPSLSHDISRNSLKMRFGMLWPNCPISGSSQRKIFPDSIRLELNHKVWRAAQNTAEKCRVLRQHRA